MELYIALAKQQFAFFGFIGCPLTNDELVSLYQRNVKLEDVYAIGCDVNAGFEFEGGKQ